MELNKLQSYIKRSKLYLRHHMVIALGDWGWDVLQRCKTALAQSHPELLPLVECIYLKEGQLGWFNWLQKIELQTDILTDQTCLEIGSRMPEGYPEELSSLGDLFRQAFGDATAQEKAKTLTNLGHYKIEGFQPKLDVHLLGRLEESFTRKAILNVVQALREKFPAPIAYRLYLYIVSDSISWERFPPEEKQDIDNFIQKLDDVLQKEMVEDYNRGHPIAICYLLDTIDEESRAISYALEQGITSERVLALRDLVAGFINLLVGSEIPEMQEYDALAYEELVKQKRELPVGKGGYCSSFSLAAYVFPLELLRTKFRCDLSRNLLAYFLPENSKDRTLANELKSEFSSKRNIEKPSLDLFFRKDEDEGKPFSFDFDPTKLDGVPDDELVDRILSWRALVEENVFPKFKKKIENKAQITVEELSSWIRQKVDELVLHYQGHTGTALDLLERLQKFIAECRLMPLSFPTRKRSFIFEIFKKEDIAFSHRKQPDLEKLKRRLQVALGQRVLRLAVWERFALYAAFESLFLALAWPFVLQGLQTIFPQLASVLYAIIALLIVYLLVLVANLLEAFNTILQSEQKVVRARDNFVKAIKIHFEIRLRKFLDEQLEQVYNHLAECIQNETRCVEQWVERVQLAQKELVAVPLERENIPLLNYERSILDVYQLKKYFPKTLEEHHKTYFEKMMREHTIPEWRQLSKSALITRVMHFTQPISQELTKELSLEAYMETEKGVPNMETLVAELEGKAKVQMDLSNSPSRYYALNLLCMEEKETSRARDAVKMRKPVILVTTLDGSHIIYLASVHGVSLRDLKIWGDLR
ncbi:MAG: hypothetical protein QW358_00320 [Candidatus Hadarchaeum sp.]